MRLYYIDDIITKPTQDLHENLLCIGDATFPGLSNQNEVNRTELYPYTCKGVFQIQVVHPLE